MSDFLARDISSEIINTHLTHLNPDEETQKLEECKKLQGLLTYLRVGRKFLVPETEIVLKNSMLELQSFSVLRAISAFRSISQYANNLVTKPWRKEFRVIKMYCGFYQHEITPNLLGAEKLFEAMGYRRSTDDTLVLDGPICPDQVSNVSHDAMLACVKLHTIRRIYPGLDAKGMSCPLLEIYRYRENLFAIDEKKRNREKALTTVIDVQPSGNYSLSASAQFPTTQCAPAQCPCNEYIQPLPPPMVGHHRPIVSSNDMCCAQHDQQQQQQQQQMTYPSQLNNHHQHYPGISAPTGAVQAISQRTLRHLRGTVMNILNSFCISTIN